MNDSSEGTGRKPDGFKSQKSKKKYVKSKGFKFQMSSAFAQVVEENDRKNERDRDRESKFARIEPEGT
jgi:hypothetical protein